MKEKVGIAGAGLMGHGIARNVLKNGYALTVLEHPGNRPLDELIGLGATTADSASSLAAQSDVIILCVTGSAEVEAVLAGRHGVLESIRPGTIVVDCSTAIPESTVRMAQAVERAGGFFLDAPMTGVARHAHEGCLNLLVGGDQGVLERAKPVLQSFARNITHAGATGAGHRLKLLHNYVSLGSIALIAEAAACAERGGIEASVFVDVLASGGGGGVALERLKPYLLEKDSQGVPFFMSNAAKDLGYYVTMADRMHATHDIAKAVETTFATAAKQGGAQALVLELVSLLASDHATVKDSLV